jgi:hypothetical protein
MWSKELSTVESACVQIPPDDFDDFYRKFLMRASCGENPTHMSVSSGLIKSCLRERTVPDNGPTEDLLTPEEVATWLRVKPAWVRAHANGNRKPKLPSLKVGAFLRFRRQDILRFLEQLSRAA